MSVQSVAPVSGLVFGVRVRSPGRAARYERMTILINQSILIEAKIHVQSRRDGSAMVRSWSAWWVERWSGARRARRRRECGPTGAATGPRRARPWRALDERCRGRVPIFTRPDHGSDHAPPFLNLSCRPCGGAGPADLSTWTVCVGDSDCCLLPRPLVSVTVRVEVGSCASGVGRRPRVGSTEGPLGITLGIV